MANFITAAERLAQYAKQVKDIREGKVPPPPLLDPRREGYGERPA